MSGKGPDQSSLRELEIELRARLSELAVARRDVVELEIEDVEATLDGYDSVLEGNPDSSVPDDLPQRVAASRLELAKLRAGDVNRRDAIGLIRLMLLPPFGDTERS